MDTKLTMTEKWTFSFKKITLNAGHEHMTLRLRVAQSTEWARQANVQVAFATNLDKSVKISMDFNGFEL